MVRYLTVRHDTDDVLLMAESQQEIEAAAESLQSHLQNQAWTINPKKIQGPSTTVQFLGVVWHGQIKEIPNKVQQTVQQFPAPATVAQLQAFVGLLGYWRTFILYLAILMRPLQKLTRKKAVGSDQQQQEAFDACQSALIEHARSYTPRQGYPFELEVTILDDGVSWRLWQTTGLKNQKEPLGFWSKALQGSATHYTPMEKQILAVVWALQETEKIMGQDSVTVHTPIPDDSVRAHAGVGQAATHWKWNTLCSNDFYQETHVTAPHATLLATISFNHVPALGETLPQETSQPLLWRRLLLTTS